MTRSKIQWTDKVWNPVRGCSRVSSGCGGPHGQGGCYAERQAARFNGPAEPFQGFVRGHGVDARWTGKVALIEDKLREPLGWKKPSRVFVNSMSDLFHEALPDEAIERVFAVMALASQHTFQILTKRPERMRSWATTERRAERIGEWMQEMALPANGRSYKRFCDRWPLPNVWLGVSVENQATADARIPILLDTPAAVRFASYEPALGPVTLTWLRVADGNVDALRGIRHDDFESSGVAPSKDRAKLDWCLVGGESGPGARPCDVAWIRSIRDQCKAAGVPCFVKQLGASPMGVFPVPYWRPIDRKGGDPAEWPSDLRVREFPA